MSFPRYESYKDSGVEWLGEVPEHWDIFAGRRVFANRRELASESDEQLAASQKYGVIPQSLMMELNDSKVMLALKGTESFRHVEKNDFVISLRSFEGGIEHSNYKGCVSPAYTVLNAIKSIEPNFFRHLFKSKAYVSALQATTDSLRDGKSITFQQFGDIQLVLPPISEQQTLAAFLDRETTKIDALISEQQRLIELLKEKRQAVISHAVTKGLNPDVPMKDSGIEWLGEVPSHWVIVPIKRICEIKDGTHDTPKYVDQSEASFPLITSKDFDGDSICFEDAKFISHEDHLEIIKRSNTEFGDVLMSMIGGNIGKALIVKDKREFSIKNVALFKTLNNHDLALYILNYLQSGLLDIQISLLSRGGAQGFLSLGDIRNLLFFKIPQEEMGIIVIYLSRYTAKLDELIQEANHQIELLQERRTALISAAVTGKIDVRSKVSTVAQSQTEVAA